VFGLVGGLAGRVFDLVQESHLETSRRWGRSACYL
jgi:hypothetical protein